MKKLIITLMVVFILFSSFVLSISWTRTLQASVSTISSVWKSSGLNVYLNDSTASVGIGTSTPEGKFDVDGYVFTGGTGTFYIREQDAVSEGGELVLLGSALGTNWSIDNLGGDLRFHNSGTEYFRIKSTGEVGIGTTSPSSKLHISSGTSGDAELTLEADTDNNNENDNPIITLNQDGGAIKGFFGLEGDAGTKSTGTLGNAVMIGTEQPLDIQLITGDSVRMTIDDVGAVGIKTTSPNESLVIDPIAGTESQLHINPDSSSDSGAYIGAKSDSNAYIASGTKRIGFGDWVNRSEFKKSIFSQTNGQHRFYASIDEGGHYNPTPYLIATINGTGMVIGDEVAANYLLTIDKNQNTESNILINNENAGTLASARVLISNDGTRNGGSMVVGGTGYTQVAGWKDTFIVNAGASLSGGLLLRANNGISFSGNTDTTGAIFIDTNQRLGIGTSTPAKEVHINGTGDTALRIESSNVAGNAAFQLKNARQQFNFRMRGDDESNSFEIIDFTHSSKIPFRIEPNVDTNTFYVSNSSGGSVGIGTSSPASTLTVNGNFSATGTKSAIINTSQGAVAYFAMESPEVRFYDEGNATLNNGSKIVQIDSLFAETIEGNYNVYVTPTGNSNGLFVINKNSVNFTVRENNRGKSNITFDYMISGFRKEYSKTRATRVNIDFENLTGRKPKIKQPNVQNMQEDNLYSCPIRLINNQKCPGGLSDGIGTRCYLYLNKSSWFNCIGGWGLS